MAHPNGPQLIHVSIGYNSEHRDEMRFKAEFFFFFLKYPHMYVQRRHG